MKLLKGVVVVIVLFLVVSLCIGLYLGLKKVDFSKIFSFKIKNSENIKEDTSFYLKNNGVIVTETNCYSLKLGDQLKFDTNITNYSLSAYYSKDNEILYFNIADDLYRLDDSINLINGFNVTTIKNGFVLSYSSFTSLINSTVDNKQVSLAESYYGKSYFLNMELIDNNTSKIYKFKLEVFLSDFGVLEFVHKEIVF